MTQIRSHLVMDTIVAVESGYVGSVAPIFQERNASPYWTRHGLSPSSNLICGIVSGLVNIGSEASSRMLKSPSG
jgi:hypothetical protein